MSTSEYTLPVPLGCGCGSRRTTPSVQGGGSTSSSSGSGADINADEINAARYFNGDASPNFLRYSSLPAARAARLPPRGGGTASGWTQLW
jgi:hypothetical protein